MMNRRFWVFAWLVVSLIALMGCTESPTPTPVADQPAALPTAAVVAELPTAPPPSPTVENNLPPTWTPSPHDLLTPTSAPLFNPTARPSATPWPTDTPTPTSTHTPVPPTAEPSVTPLPPTATPYPTSAVPTGANLLPNPSFEGGWYHPNGDPELQIPDRWRFEFIEGENSLDPDPWNRWVRPEVRVLPADFLPPQEHDTFIWDGQQTLKVFKGQGAINYQLLTDVQLEPGRYRLTIYVYPDLVMGYSPLGGKIWADDPLAGEVSLWTGPLKSPWYLPSFGRRNEFSQEFVVDQPGSVAVGVAIRGRWAIENNGWFFDNWRLQRVDG